MYSTFQVAKKYIHYYLTASNGKGHGIHSPFVFDFVYEVLNDKRNFYAYNQIETLRQELLHDNTLIQVNDLGAGSGISKSTQRRIDDIAKHAAKNRKLAQLLFRIANYFQPKTIIELGTSLGVSSAYLAAARPASKLYTIEGSPEIAAVALKNFRSLQLSNIEPLVGNFDELLPGLLKKIRLVDLAFIDGNHRKEPTIKYFNQLAEYSTASSVLIFDDIHWSSEMEDAWNIIKISEKVTLTIDLFFLGIVFFKKDFKAKQHFIIRF
ncbi:MAG TPA: class I SAM-dependent methyltransferase [Puia sp.]|nr:class I SAM-dependent methyltransferase [Puia sp.]